MTESLALDQAPFTRMTPLGTFATTPPEESALSLVAPWPRAGSDKNKAKMSKETEYRKRIVLTVKGPARSLWVSPASVNEELQRAQKVEQILLLLVIEIDEVLHHLISFAP